MLEPGHKTSTFLNEHFQKRVGIGSFNKYENLFQRTSALIANSTYFRPQTDANLGMLWEQNFRYMFGKGMGKPNPANFFRDLLSHPANYEPNCIAALFWSLTFAQQNFATTFLPFWSHEERLTGHFISQILERSIEFEPYWASLALSLIHI